MGAVPSAGAVTGGAVLRPRLLPGNDLQRRTVRGQGRGRTGMDLRLRGAHQRAHAPLRCGLEQVQLHHRAPAPGGCRGTEPGDHVAEIEPYTKEVISNYDGFTLSDH